MRHTRFIAFIVLFFSLITNSQAQISPATGKQIPFINSNDLIDKGVAENDNGNYKKALSYYEQIPDGDTNYLLALYEQSLSNINDSNYAKGISMAKLALALNSPEKRLLMLNMAKAMELSGQKDDAQKVYDSVTTLFPFDSRPYLERAIIKYRAKDYSGAQQLLQQGLMLDPKSFSCNFLLGNAYAAQGRLSESIMALSTSLLCTDNYDVAKNAIAILTSVAIQTDDIATFYNDKKSDGRDPAFDETDEIVHAKLALNKGYQLKSALDDNIFRQLQVVMEKLEYDNKDTNFAMQFYVPLYSRVYKQDQFEPFVLLMFSNYGFKSIDKLNDSHKGKARLETVKTTVYPYLDSIFETRVLSYTERQQSVKKYHFDPKNNTIIDGVFADKEEERFAPGKVKLYKNQNLTAVGNYNANDKKEGIWKYYYPSGKIRMTEQLQNGESINSDTSRYENGNIKMINRYNSEHVAVESSEYNYNANDKKEGIWKYYYPSGKIRMTEQLQNGESINSDTSRYENGNIKMINRYNSEHVAVESSEYNYNGSLNNVAQWKAKNEYEYTYYYPSGAVISKQTYTNEVMKDGKYVVFFEDGRRKKEFAYKNGKLNGSYTTYFENGQIDETVPYTDGAPNGAYKSYYENGTLAKEYTTIAGNEQGIVTEYNENNTPASKYNYDKGKLNGESFLFDRTGNQYGSVTYKNDRIVETKFRMADGSEKISKINGDNSAIDLYNEYGTLIRKAQVDKNGLYQGKTSYYYECGGLKEETNYLDDQKNGTSVTYHENGNVNVVRQYKNDTLDGYYQQSNEAGKLIAEGWMKENEGKGLWRRYYPNGNIQMEYYLVGGKMNGSAKNFESDGKLDYTLLYDNDMITGLTQYDTSGKVTQHETFDKGNGTLKLIYPNGDTQWECHLKYGKWNGPYFSYNGNKSLITKGLYAYGKYDGDFESYYPNGQLMAKGTYKNDAKEKTRTDYSIDGWVEYISHYENDLATGFDSVFTGGNLTSVKKYHNDNLDSANVMFGENGKIAGVIYYNMGMVTGYTYQDKDGKLLPVKPLKNATGHLQTYYANGNKALDFTWNRNNYQGKQLSWFSNGQLQQEANYDKDLRNGDFMQYNPDGSNFYEAHFKDGVKQGICKTYNNKGKQIFVVNFTDDEMNGAATYTDAQGQNHNYWYHYGAVVK